MALKQAQGGYRSVWLFRKNIDLLFIVFTNTFNIVDWQKQYAV